MLLPPGYKPWHGTQNEAICSGAGPGCGCVELVAGARAAFSKFRFFASLGQREAALRVVSIVVEVAEAVTIPNNLGPEKKPKFQVQE